MNPMNKAGRSATLLFLLIVLTFPLRGANAQTSEDIYYFPETGHNVRGEFLRFYRNAIKPALVYGHPITEQFTSRDGRIVQYFQRARFELQTGVQENGSVLLTLLGSTMYEPGSQRLEINNPTACRLFPTNYHVCFTFLDFYETNGGEAQFGYPISPFEFQENLIVQYFERARFEWRADRPEGQRVVLTDLGRLYFDRLAEDQAHLRPIRPLDATISPILSIRARAFVSNAITQSDGQQTVHVLVQSQTHQPVSNASGRATVSFPDHNSQEYFFTTDESGLGSIRFNFENQKQGELVQVDIVVLYQGLSTRTTTSYRIWH